MSGGNLQRLSQCLVELRLPTFREHHSSQAALASKESWSYPQYLLALSELEVADRRERRIQRLRRTSKLPWDKSLTALERSRLPQSVDRQLSVLVEGDFLDRAESLLVFGNPGSGKTHLVCALGQELILQNRRVLFSTCTNSSSLTPSGWGLTAPCSRSAASLPSSGLLFPMENLLPL